jgi:hypothetical protein
MNAANNSLFTRGMKIRPTAFAFLLALAAITVTTSLLRTFTGGGDGEFQPLAWSRTAPEISLGRAMVPAITAPFMAWHRPAQAGVRATSIGSPGRPMDPAL